MKKYLVLFLLSSFVGIAQNLNEYKYAILPSKFAFSKEENAHNLNTLSKMYLQKYGFETYFHNEAAPDEFILSYCNKIFVDVTENSTIFITKLKITIKDCKGNILATSEQGTSKEKEYRVAYNEALRMAFDNFSILKTHQFQNSQKSLGMIGEPLQKEIAQGQIAEKKYNVIATETGYNLITVASDYKLFQLFKTTSKDIYLAKRDSISGVLLKKDSNWFFEYYEGNVLKSELINITF
ncbi:hypothetical protein [Flavobacterium sp.]|uniref:hypothetical protein n=1 Tax=Flavobacterium sp. TaxID=239 RepID=UPI0033418531